MYDDLAEDPERLIKINKSNTYNNYVLIDKVKYYCRLLWHLVIKSLNVKPKAAFQFTLAFYFILVILNNWRNRILKVKYTRTVIAIPHYNPCEMFVDVQNSGTIRANIDSPCSCFCFYSHIIHLQFINIELNPICWCVHLASNLSVLE